MHKVVIEAPYRFVPPHHGSFWPALLQRAARWWLRREHGLTRVEVEGADRLRASLAARHGVLVAPNHCRPSDPFVVAEMARQVGTTTYTMASWHLFCHSRLQTWVLRHGGGFSVFREGLDRAAVNAAVDILDAGRRPLVIFPEGALSRTNDRLNPLMEGTAFIARAAAKKRAKAEPDRQVVVHPTAIRYCFRGHVERALAPALDDLERRLSWRTQRQSPPVERIVKLGQALLGLKEVEHLGAAQTGTIAERLERLIDHLLAPLEREWLEGRGEGGVVARVKRLRAAVLPDLVQGEIAPEERDRRWRQLEDMYLAQQLSCYPPDYIRTNPTAERLLETVERFEEDLTDRARIFGEFTARVRIGEAIPVNPARDRGASEDPLMTAIEASLRGMLEELRCG